MFEKILINQHRLLSDIQSFGQIGALEGGGVARLALTDNDGLGRDELVRRMKALGLRVSIDPIGNIFGTRAGKTTATVMTGSHIDTVLTGGLYDGTYGVLAGLEVIAALNDAGCTTEHSITVVAFTNEEGSRFQPDMLGSLVFAGGMSIEAARSTRDAAGVTLGDELDRIGYAGTGYGPEKIISYYELHIEQGPVLEDENIQIGVVTGVQGISWTRLTVTGRSAHAGTTPMRSRADAGLAAMELVTSLSAILKDIPDQLLTCGSFRVVPDLVNVVPQRCVLTLDLRNPNEKLLLRAEECLSQIILDIEATYGVSIQTETLARFEPVPFDSCLIDRIENLARDNGYSTGRLCSGAGHDAQMIARLAPAAMIFVPSVNGLSHNIAELTLPDDLCRGTQVLLDAILSSVF
ncbi:allantoate amidohydrolase [Acetobacter malorum]|uniref:Allantoate amidohydrolase n=2 Tax=Acetobacter malorum TaxID=178901 RepID=A0A149UPE7_9PROT|nr:allantoate amidohydrolase [Acetobacter malorum]